MIATDIFLVETHVLKVHLIIVCTIILLYKILLAKKDPVSKIFNCVPKNCIGVHVAKHLVSMVKDDQDDIQIGLPKESNWEPHCVRKRWTCLGVFIWGGRERIKVRPLIVSPFRSLSLQTKQHCIQMNFPTCGQLIMIQKKPS